MTNQISLKQIEKKAYLAYHRDGLWDLFLGLTLIGFGLFIRFDQPYLMGIWATILIVTLPKTKIAFARSRLGQVEFSAARKEKEKKGRTGLMILLTFTCLLGVVFFYAFTGDAEWQLFLRSLGMIPFGFVISLVLSAVGLFFGIYRFIVYGVIIISCFVVGNFIGTEPAAIFIILGIIPIIVGLILLVGFIRKYPKPPHGADYVR